MTTYKYRSRREMGSFKNLSRKAGIGLSVKLIGAIEAAVRKYGPIFCVRPDSEAISQAIMFVRMIAESKQRFVTVERGCKHYARIMKLARALREAGLIDAYDWDSWKKGEEEDSVAVPRQFILTSRVAWDDQLETEKRCFSYAQYRNKQYYKIQDTPVLRFLKALKTDVIEQIGK